MADVQITDLTQISTPNSSDKLLIRHGSTDSQIAYSDLKTAVTTNTLFVDDDGVVTDEANLYYNRSQVDTLVNNLQTQITAINNITKSRGTYTNAETLYNEVLSTLDSSQSMFCMTSGNASMALTNNITTAGCRAYISKADQATLDYILYCPAASKVYIGRISSNATVTICVEYAKQSEIDTLNSKTIVSAVNTRNSISANDITLYNCTGQITSGLYIHISGSVAMIEGRITIRNYVRTGTNPGVIIDLPNKRVKRNFAINSGFTATGTNGIRFGEMLNTGGAPNQAQISINTTETHSDLASDGYAWFIIMPIFFEII